MKLFDKTDVPYKDLYLFCKRYNKSFDDFIELYNVRKDIWKDMDEFDECMKNRIFRILYVFSDFYKDERKLRRLAKAYWSGRKDIPDDLCLYYRMAKASEKDQFNVFFRLMKWKEIYMP